MSADRWLRMGELFHAALERTPSDRRAFLEAECAGDDTLLREVESLLAAHAQPGEFMDRPALESDPYIGATLSGRYRVERELGRGGIGVVYLARDTQLLSKPVVVKVLLDHTTRSANAEWFARKFEQEVEALARIDHPGVVGVLDTGTTPGGRPFFVMQYVEGTSLRAEVRPDGLPLAVAADLIRQIGHALTAAHEKGVLHRDLKPENVMVQELAGGERHTKLIDFGIAKVEDSNLSASTTADMLVGTASYMAPEQLRSEKLTLAVDVYALGVMAYELVTGRLPFEASTLVKLAEKQREGVRVRPRELRRELPAAAETAILRALSFAASERFASARGFADELARALQTTDSVIVTRPLSPPEMAASPAADARATLPATNLPPRASAPIGRERELGEVTSLVRKEEARLLTLTGPGGTGKTCLALEAARLLYSDFADGTFLVDLSALSDPERIATQIAEVLQLKESVERSPAEELERYLADKRLLLVLDNFEHLLAGATLVSRLLGCAPGLAVLATSRALLQLRQEREYSVEPLEVPVFTSLLPLAELERRPAVALFLERAREAKPSFALTAENAQAVVEVCRRVEGLPLALELAAARIRLLSPSAMLERLDRQLKVLKGGAVDLPTRQQTMRGAVAWSYDLLDEAERAVLRRLAVFAGGCMLEAAEAVCGHGEVDVLDVVGSLANKSLLKLRESEKEEVRFAMLEVVREYALEQLDASGEADEARLEHARYFRHLAKEADLQFLGAEQAVWVKRLARENENLKAALDVMLERKPEEGAAFVLDLIKYWGVRSMFVQAREWCARALEGVAPELRARLLITLGDWEARLGDFGSGVPRLREAVEACRTSGDTFLLGTALFMLGRAYFAIDDVAGARQAFEEGLAAAREAGADHPAMSCLTGLGTLEEQAGNTQAARARYEQVLEAYGHVASAFDRGIILVNLGSVALKAGDMVSADGYFRSVLAIGSELGSLDLCTDALDGIAAIVLEAGEPGKAAQLVGAVEMLRETERIKAEPSEKAQHDSFVAMLRSTLDAEVFEREWARGRAMTLEEAIEAALGA